MSDVNMVTLLGNLGSDVSLRHTASGTAVSNFRLATNESWIDKNGNKRERTQWHRITVWGRQAELCKEYLNKGRQVYLTGKLVTHEWTDNGGVKRYTTEVHSNFVKFLGGKRNDEIVEEIPAEEFDALKAEEEEEQYVEA